MSIIWAVTGAKFTADSARMETFKSTNGSRGVTLPQDLKVTALPTPGPYVRVNAGGATTPVGFLSAPGQSYGMYFPTATDVPVPATDSSGPKVRYLFLRVMDPQFEGSVPEDPINAEYPYFFWHENLTPSFVGPYVLLCSINQPASTATITSGMITDRRKLTKQRVEREVTSNNNAAVTDLTSTTGQRWPNYTVEHVIPSWANWYHMIVHISGYFQTSALADVQLWPRIGGISTGGSLFVDHDNFIDGVRYSLSATASGLIPAGFAGNARTFDVWGARIAAGTHPGIIRADWSTHIAYDIQFEERIL